MGQNQGMDKSELCVFSLGGKAIGLCYRMVFWSLDIQGTNLFLDGSRTSSTRLCPVANINGV